MTSACSRCVWRGWRSPVVKRMLVPTMFLVLTFTMVTAANAQVVTCSISSTGATIGVVPQLPGVTANASDAGQVEVGASGVHGISDMPGGGRGRISCTNTNAAAVSPGGVVLTVTFGDAITNNQTHPSTAAGIRLINSTGDFIAPGALGPTDANPGNIGIAAVNNAAGQIVIGLGTPGSTAGSSTVAPTIP